MERSCFGLNHSEMFPIPTLTSWCERSHSFRCALGQALGATYTWRINDLCGDLRLHYIIIHFIVFIIARANIFVVDHCLLPEILAWQGNLRHCVHGLSLRITLPHEGFRRERGGLNKWSWARGHGGGTPLLDEFSILPVQSLRALSTLGLLMVRKSCISTIEVEFWFPKISVYLEWEDSWLIFLGTINVRGCWYKMTCKTWMLLSL